MRAVGVSVSRDLRLETGADRDAEEKLCPDRLSVAVEKSGIINAE